MYRFKTGIIASFVAGLTIPFSGWILYDHAAPPQASESVPLCVMTFNLRYASPKPPNSWPERRPVMGRCIRQIAPDILGTQEGLYSQLKDLAADLSSYQWIGLGRDGGSRGEFMAVFYRPERFEPVAYDHFWLSDTPETIGSSTWGNTNRRMVTWVRFRERRAGREFYFWNTHLDHLVETARQKGAALIVERVRGLQTDLPVILTGDFNCAAFKSKSHEIFLKEGGFADTWSLASVRLNEKLNSELEDEFVGREVGGDAEPDLSRAADLVDGIDQVVKDADGPVGMGAAIVKLVEED